jgi:glutamate-1-semialdehyde 2,1-aminomutase
VKRETSVEEYTKKFPKSRALYEKALDMFPRGVTHDIRFVQPFPIYITHAKGSHKWDADGYEYVDYIGGHGALMLGHAHPSVVNAVNEQISKGTHYGACHKLEIEWAALIKELIPSIERVEFTNSGTEAVMLALRLARAFTGRSKIIKFEDHFHGWHDHVMVGVREPWHMPASSGLLDADSENTIVIAINDVVALEKVLANRDIAVLMVEAAGAHSGATGISPPFYQAMRELTKTYGTLLLFDEVVTGFRFSPGGVQAIRRIIPDLTTLGKIVVGGLPGAGAVGGRSDVMDMLAFKDDPEWNRYKRLSHSGTFNANPLCAAAGIATLKVLATGEPQKQADKMAGMLRNGMQRVLEERAIIGCAYGESSTYHFYIGECNMRNKCDRTICLNATKMRPVDMGRALYINLTLNGVSVAARAVDGFTSAAHSEEDINNTIEAFAVSLDRAIAEDVLQDYIKR